MKDSFNLDGKIYISSRRAAEMSKYSNDYIGQLCRGGKVVAKMIGRNWFVDQDSLIQHKKNSDEAFEARARIVCQNQQKVFTLAQAGVTPASQSGWPFTYGADSRPLMPEIRKNTPQFIAKDSENNKRTKINGLLFKRSFMVFLVISIFLTGSFLLIVDSGNVPNVQSNSQVGQASGPISRIFTAFGSGMNKIFSFFNGGSNDSNVNYVQDVNQPALSANSAWNGMAVVRSTVEDDAVRQKISNSFSDTVKIRPDDSGTAGVITPVFKRTNGDDFMYVLVPVKEDVENANK